MTSLGSTGFGDNFYVSVSSRVCSLCLISRRPLPCIRSSSAIMSQRSFAPSRNLSVASPPILNRLVLNPSDILAYYLYISTHSLYQIRSNKYCQKRKSLTRQDRWQEGAAAGGMQFATAVRTEEGERGHDVERNSSKRPGAAVLTRPCSEDEGDSEAAGNVATRSDGCV